jgi:gentisate 1,2-dioxygenase
VTTVDETALAELYADMARNDLAPLWTQTADLMPRSPRPEAIGHVWHWADLYAVARRAGELVPVGRGGERRAIALANPALGGLPYATATLWAAIQYLGPRETAPEHRHSQSAFRFVLEGEGVWTVVDGDPVAMRRGDLLLTPGWAFHGHQNVTDEPMAWLDGLDIPFINQIEAGFFEFGPERLTDVRTPVASRCERLWGHPGLSPVAGLGARRSSPLAAYRWEHTDRALAAQLDLEHEGHQTTIHPGHAAVRFVNPTSGGDALTTIRLEMHRLRAGTSTPPSRSAGSAVWQVFAGDGRVRLDDATHSLRAGDVFAVQSWQECTIEADSELDLFVFSDAPIFAALGLERTESDAPVPPNREERP